MFLRKDKANKPQSRIDSLIGTGTKIEGDVTFVGGLRVDGEVKGNVRSTGDGGGTLVLSEHARIEEKSMFLTWLSMARLSDLSIRANSLNFSHVRASLGMSSTTVWKCIWVPLSKEGLFIKAAPAKPSS